MVGMNPELPLMILKSLPGHVCALNLELAIARHLGEVAAARLPEGTLVAPNFRARPTRARLPALGLGYSEQACLLSRNITCYVPLFAGCASGTDGKGLPQFSHTIISPRRLRRTAAGV